MSTSDRSGQPPPPAARPAAAPAVRRAQAPRKPRRPMPTAVDVGHGEDPRLVLGRLVHGLRIKLGVSQEDLADRVGLDRTYVSGIERGIRNPTFLVLLRLAQALDVPPARLLQGEDGGPV